MRQKTKDCIICFHKNNGGRRAAVAPLKPITVIPKVMWRVHVDLAGPYCLSKSGNKYLAIGICAFSKYIEAMRNFNFKIFFICSKELSLSQIFFEKNLFMSGNELF